MHLYHSFWCDCPAHVYICVCMYVDRYIIQAYAYACAGLRLTSEAARRMNASVLGSNAHSTLGCAAWLSISGQTEHGA